MLNKQLDFVGNRNKFFIGSGVLIAITLLVTIFFGAKLDIQFTGGTIITYAYEGEVDVNSFKSDLSTVFGNSVKVQEATNAGTGEKNLVVSLSNNTNSNIDKLKEAQTLLGTKYKANNFRQSSADSVNPQMGGEFFAKCLVAVLIAFVLIVLYIGIRFRKIGGMSAGIMAVVALVHDIMIIFAVFVLLRMNIDDNFMAVCLTIMGYSINDTIVIYDRIRENSRLRKSVPIDELVNISLNQVKRRTLNTTITTVMAMGVVCIVALIFNVNSILNFAFPMIVGMISGVYSSLCIAPNLWIIYKNKKDKKAKKA